MLTKMDIIEIGAGVGRSLHTMGTHQNGSPAWASFTRPGHPSRGRNRLSSIFVEIPLNTTPAQFKTLLQTRIDYYQDGVGGRLASGTARTV